MGGITHLGGSRELFVDNYLIDNISGACLKLHHPVSGGIAIKYDQSWETSEKRAGSFYTTIFQDNNLFRMYYRGDSTKVCYAESEDGIDWVKPNLGLIEDGGSDQNNIIMPLKYPGSAFCAFLDSNPNALPDQRIKGNAHGAWPKGADCAELYGFSSADATNWVQIKDAPLIEGTLPNHWDAQNSVFWSDVEQQYVIYARYMVGPDGMLGENFRKIDEKSRIRSTARATSPDFENWSEFVPMEFSDTDSITPSAQLYTNQTIPYFRANHIYISLPGRIFFKKIKNPKIVKDQADFGDCSDGVLMTTRAGSNRYDFTFRESLLRPGIGDKNWTTRNNYPACGVIQTGESEMSIFVQRHYAQTTAYLERMTLRLDGFASLNAGYEEGQMTTKPLDFTGNKLELNYSTSAAGSIRVGLFDVFGTPLDGYSLEDCDELIGDEISGYVSWEGSTDLSKVVEKPVRVRFVMNDADIYSLSFVN